MLILLSKYWLVEVIENDCIMTRVGVYDEILPEPSGSGNISSHTPPLVTIQLDYHTVCHLLLSTWARSPLPKACVTYISPFIWSPVEKPGVFVAGAGERGLPPPNTPGFSTGLTKLTLNTVISSTAKQSF